MSKNIDVYALYKQILKYKYPIVEQQQSARGYIWIGTTNQYGGINWYRLGEIDLNPGYLRLILFTDFPCILAI